ncbi:hypothetical protein ACSFB8_04890 [Enterococcus faecalis]
MKASQEQFYNFIIERTKPDKEEAMKQLLAELLERQGTNQLDKMYLMGVMPRAISYLKPEAVNEVKNIVSEFTKKL